MATLASVSRRPAAGAAGAKSLLSEAVRQRADLSYSFYQAMDHSDNVVVLLEQRNEILSILAVNDQTQLTTGYLSSELIGRPITVLTGPETDPVALEACLAAAREGRAHRTQLLCRRRTGQGFWFGLHLMPADEPDGVRRFLILGHDITEKLRREDRDKAVQSLLAKVFVTVDAPVYILDLQSTCLMTNPAFERLVGARSGALVGSNVLERYPPASQAAIAAGRKQQDIDGLDYHLEVMLRTETGEVPRRMTGVLVQRPDGLRFRIVTLLPAQPASPQAAPVRVTAAGRVQLIGLDEVRDTLGPRWPALAERAMATAEHVLRRRLGPRDTFSRTDDHGFIVCFAGATEAEAATIGRELRARLIGEGESPEVAHVLSTATEVPPEVQHLSAAELNAIVQTRLNQRLKATQDTARVRLQQAVQEATYEVDAVHTKQDTDPVGLVVRLPIAADRAIQAARGVLPAAETKGLSVDALLLGFAQTCMVEDALGGGGHLVFLTLSTDVLLVSGCIDACLRVCRSIKSAQRQRLVLIISIPPGMAFSPLAAGLIRLRPFCRFIGVAVDAMEAEHFDGSSLNLALEAVDAHDLVGMPNWQAKLRALAASLQAHRCRLMVRGATSADEASAFFSEGAHFVSMAGGSG
jgi:PAS domain S-box-containing protein